MEKRALGAIAMAVGLSAVIAITASLSWAAGPTNRIEASLATGQCDLDACSSAGGGNFDCTIDPETTTFNESGSGNTLICYSPSGGAETIEFSSIGDRFCLEQKNERGDCKHSLTYTGEVAGRAHFLYDPNS